MMFGRAEFSGSFALANLTPPMGLVARVGAQTRSAGKSCAPVAHAERAQHNALRRSRAPKNTPTLGAGSKFKTLAQKCASLKLWLARANVLIVLCVLNCARLSCGRRTNETAAKWAANLLTSVCRPAGRPIELLLFNLPLKLCRAPLDWRRLGASANSAREQEQASPGRFIAKHSPAP